MTHDDLSYYLHRAAAEVERAQRAACPEARALHDEMAHIYLDRVHVLEGAGEPGRV